ncbi:excisionase family DNA-binding protein [Burkholderia vietnamiensis]|uniref:excisionase family DNA-binding protein n=1 Tax=Burkholderia vietnamiensis TaxID=60552 RepID=UPI00159407F4|nr:excisionase family DNA-binding protein [Burkholderia vietnamiensis]
MNQLTAESVFQDLKKLPSSEQMRFFAILGRQAVQSTQDNFSHEEVFGHLAEDEFTSAEAADYLEVSMSTFRRYVHDGKLTASSEMGRNQLFATKDLKAFKRALKEVKSR